MDVRHLLRSNSLLETFYSTHADISNAEQRSDGNALEDVVGNGTKA